MSLPCRFEWLSAAHVFEDESAPNPAAVCRDRTVRALRADEIFFRLWVPSRIHLDRIHVHGQSIASGLRSRPKSPFYSLLLSSSRVNSTPSPFHFDPLVISAMRRRRSILSPVASPLSPYLDHPAFSYLRQVLPRRVSQILEILLALIVRKVWGSAPDSSETALSLGNWSVSAHDYQQPLSLGDLDRLPTDVIVQILKLLGSKEVASSSLVCSSWRVLVSDNRLWIFFLKHGKEPFETVVFAETQLRSGPM